MLTTNTVIPIENIHVHRVNVVTPIKKQIDSYKEIARLSPKTLPPINLGRVDGRLYVLSNFDLYYAIRDSRLAEIQAQVTDFKDITEFVIEHVKLNKNPTGFNPLLLFGVMDYLKDQGISQQKALGLLHVYKTLDQKLLELPLQHNAIRKLCKLYSFLSEKLSNLTIPFYISQAISNCEDNKQGEAVSKIEALIRTGKVSDTKFTWPSVEEIETILKNPSYHKTVKDSKIVNLKEVKPSIKEKKISKELLTKSKNVIIIPGNNKHPSIMVNKKTGTVQTIVEKNTVIKLIDKESKPVYNLPQKAVDHLDLEKDTTNLKMKCFTKSSDMVSFLKKHPKLQAVLYYR